MIGARRLPSCSEINVGGFDPFGLRATRLLAEGIGLPLVGEGDHVLNELDSVNGVLTILQSAFRRLPELGPDRRQAAQNLRLEHHAIALADRAGLRACPAPRRAVPQAA